MIKNHETYRIRSTAYSIIQHTAQHVQGLEIKLLRSFKINNGFFHDTLNKKYNNHQKLAYNVARACITNFCTVQTL